MTELRNLKWELLRFRRRIWVAGLFMLFMFGVLVLRLIVVQVLRHDIYAQQAENNRIAVVPIVPNRGWILDRNGVVLANNYSAYTLEITPSETGLDDLEPLIAQLGQIIRIEPRDIKRFKKLRAESKNFEPIALRSRLSDEEVARFTAQRYRFPGVDVQSRMFRSYPLQETASHVLGYIGRINQKEKEDLEDMDPEVQANYKGTDYIGKLGIEQSYEDELHGTTGVEQMETSASGRALRQLGEVPAKAGENIVLSIDIKLQKMVEDMFGDRRGALVAIDPRNGEVLAFVSKPTFDPNLFIDGIDVDNWRALNESINHPLLNRALRGTYPPGSTFKPYMALAALQMGLRSPSFTIYDPGYWMFGKHKFRSAEAGGLGVVDMYRSIVKSSNVYYYSLANEMGVDTIHDFMAPLGFGQLTGIDLEGEVTGVLPSTAWKRKRYATAKNPRRGDWVAGETISLGIGQGYNNFTILQLAHAVSILANGGTNYRPHIAVATQDMATGVRTPLPEPTPIAMGYKPENIAIVRHAMIGVTQEGTSRRAFSGAKYISAGKTGTAQAVTIAQNEKYNASHMKERERDHALYIAFAPAENPTIALAVIVENAGFGGDQAAPIARRVFDYWLLGQYPSEEDMNLIRYGKVVTPVGQPRKAADVPLVPDQQTLVVNDAGAITERAQPTAPPAIQALPDAKIEGGDSDDVQEDAGTGTGTGVASPPPAITTVPSTQAVPTTPAAPSAPPAAAALPADEKRKIKP